MVLVISVLLYMKLVVSSVVVKNLQAEWLEGRLIGCRDGCLDGVAEGC
jgi:hypothetical protein